MPNGNEAASNAVGIVANPTLDDLREIMPDVAQSLQQVLEYEGDVEEDLMLTHQVSFEEYGKVYTKDLTMIPKNFFGEKSGESHSTLLYDNGVLFFPSRRKAISQRVIINVI